jgi:8-amino-7-oxononanoate synthase
MRDARATTTTPSTSSSTDPWSAWLRDANAALVANDVDRALRPVNPPRHASSRLGRKTRAAFVYDAAVETMRRWASGEGDLGDSVDAGAGDGAMKTSMRVFSGNDYLGLATHARTRRAAARAAQAFGCGPRSSALVCGYTTMHRALERALAELSETEECALFPSGFAANSTTLAAVCGAADVCVFSDALNHASIVDGCRLAKQSGAEVRTFAHLDYDDLERQLKACDAPRKVIVSDSLFSMDGDYADVDRLVKLKREHACLLVLDEAHATLVCGDRGGGVAQASGKCADVDVHVGTLSKAVGAHGGFVACSREMKRFLISRARGHMFSTALPAPVVAAALESLKVFAEEPSIRAKLWRNISRFNAALARSHLNMKPLVSPIGSLVIGEAQDALEVSASLLRSGFHVPAIRPPTVAVGSSRLRIALSAAHDDRDIDDLARTLLSTIKPPVVRSRL